MRTKSFGNISIVGFKLFQPIFDLVEKLESKTPNPPNEVQSGFDENGYSAAIIVLAVLILESAINRTKYFRKEITQTAAPKFFAKICDDINLIAEVKEAFTCRDVIVHNHIWKGEIFWDDDGSLKYDNRPKLLDGYGNKRFASTLDSVTEQSIRLGINLLPPRIWRRDAYIVLRVVVRAIMALHDSLNEQHFFFRTHVVYRSNLLSVDQAMNQIKVPSL